MLFEDPDGVRLEINYVPGQGLLSKDGPQPSRPSAGFRRLGLPNRHSRMPLFQHGVIKLKITAVNQRAGGGNVEIRHAGGFLQGFKVEAENARHTTKVGDRV